MSIGLALELGKAEQKKLEIARLFNEEMARREDEIKCKEGLGLDLSTEKAALTEIARLAVVAGAGAAGSMIGGSRGAVAAASAAVALVGDHSNSKLTTLIEAHKAAALEYEKRVAECRDEAATERRGREEADSLHKAYRDRDAKRERQERAARDIDRALRNKHMC